MAAASPSVGRSRSSSSFSSSSYHPGLQKKSQEVPIPKFHLVVAATEDVEAMERSDGEEEELLDDALFETRHEQHLAEMHRQYEVVREEQERLKRTRVLARQGGGKSWLFNSLVSFLFFFWIGYPLKPIPLSSKRTDLTFFSFFLFFFFFFSVFLTKILTKILTKTQKVRRTLEELVEGARREEVQGLVDQGEQVPQQDVLVVAGVALLPRRCRAAMGAGVGVEVVGCVQTL